jgi:hypothetical protein
MNHLTNITKSTAWTYLSGMNFTAMTGGRIYT